MFVRDHTATVLACAALIAGNAAQGQRTEGGTMKADYYVATNGSDSWSGTLASPAADGNDGPFATVGRAREAVREGGRAEAVSVLVRGGTYRLERPLVFGPEDSGTAAAPVTYAAYPGETPVLSGGRVISGFRQEGRLWVTTVPEAAAQRWPFLQLFVNGERRRRARTPDEGYLRMVGALPPVRVEGKDEFGPNKTGFRFRRGDVEEWARLGDVNIVLIHSWENSIHPVASVDTESCIVRFVAPMKEWWKIGHWEREARYYVENALELLDQPGEWYLNGDTSVLSYFPMPGEEPDQVEVVAPVLTEFVRFQGEADAGLFVEHVHVRGLSFHHADWTLSPKGNSNTQAAVDVPAVITADGARHCTVADCEVGHLGNYGIWFRRGCKDCTVEGNHVFDLGAGGIRVGEARMAETDAGETSRTLVHNNYIHHYGEVYAGAVGVWMAQSSHNRVTHNEIHDGNYTGISVGWNWNKAPNRTHHNLIADNHVHHVVRGVLSDGAGIYTLGTQTGTVIRGNVFHDVFPYMGSPAMAWGIYFDQGSNGMLAENNIVYNTVTGGLMNTGQSGNTVRNNIFAFSAWHAVWRWAYAGEPPSTVEHNIFYITQGELFHPDAGADDTESKWDRNLYWRTDGKSVDFYDDTFEEWQAKGLDRSSCVADPGFVDPERYDFRLKSDSPALELGFVPIDASQAGLTRDSRWRGLLKTNTRTVLPGLPPEPEPELVHDRFDDARVGDPPAGAHVYVEGRGDSIEVTDELAASGKHCLKVVDVAGLEHVWNPHMFYQPHFRDGKAKLELDVRLGEGAVFAHEWRDARRPFSVGPSIQIKPDGTLLANGTALGTVALDAWLHLRITCGLGSACDGTYDLTVAGPEGERIVRSGLALGSPKFRRLVWLGFVSLAQGPAVFFLDNIMLDIEKN